LGAFCNFNTGVSFTTDIGFGGYPGVIAQHYTLYADRYIAGTYPTDWVYGYLNWETDVWWTRTDASYDISSNSQSWTYNGFNCSQSFDPHSTSGGGITISWSGSSTPTYAYYSPMNGWPILWAGVCGSCGIMTSSQHSDVTELGSYAGGMNGSYSYQKN
jgi:hypothetical protein